MLRTRSINQNSRVDKVIDSDGCYRASPTGSCLRSTPLLYTLVVPYTRSSFRSRTRLRGTRRENRYCPATIRSFERDESRPRFIPQLTIAKVRVYFTVSRFHSEEELRKSELRVIRSQVHGERKLVINVPPTPIQSIPFVFFTNRYEFARILQIRFYPGRDKSFLSHHACLHGITSCTMRLLYIFFLAYHFQQDK